MRSLLVVGDMQNDFVDGSLGTPEAKAIVKNVVDKIEGWDGNVIATQDTHFQNYLETNEGKHLPVLHCVGGTKGYSINPDVKTALSNHEGFLGYLSKFTFGSINLPEIIRSGKYERIEIIGLCTDICVISNALILKAYYPEIEMAVDASCCAGVTQETHLAALSVMKMCQIDILNDPAKVGAEEK